MIHDEPIIRPLGDCYLSVEFGDEVNLESSFRGLALKEALDALDIPGIVEIYVTLPTVAIVLDRLQTSYGKVERIVRDALHEMTVPISLPSRRVEMPIWYNDPWSAALAGRDSQESDFEFVARINGLTPADLLEVHSSTDYWVVLVGFVPGVNLHYPLNPTTILTAPKLKTPRITSPSRAACLAGRGTGQYSMPSPGGYQLIGRLAVDIYQPERRSSAFAENGVLLRPGDRISYRSVDAFEYEDIWDRVQRGTYEYVICDEVFDVARHLSERSTAEKGVSAQAGT